MRASGRRKRVAAATSRPPKNGRHFSPRSGRRGRAGSRLPNADAAPIGRILDAGSTADPAVREPIAGIHGAASAAGLVAAIHAGSVNAGHAMAHTAFQMLTLESEAQAVRRGAAASLSEASGDR